MKFDKQDIKCLVAFIIILAITRHIVVLTYVKLTTPISIPIMQMIKSTDYQNIISSGDIIAAFVFCYLIRKCCGGHMMKAGLITFMLFYFMSLYITGRAIPKTYSMLLNKDVQIGSLLMALPPAIAAMIVCKIC